MKKGIKVVIFVVIVLLIVLIGDTLYAYVNKSAPIIHLKNKSTNVDEGIFFDVYHCDGEDNKIVDKFSKYKCSIDDKSNKDETATAKITTEKISARKKAFSEEILNKYNEYGNVDKDNLKYFEIIDILNYGYYTSKPEEIYYHVRINYECNDGTKRCISLKIGEDNISFNEYDGYYNLWIIAKNDKVIKFMTGVSININLGFVFKYESIE